MSQQKSKILAEGFAFLECPRWRDGKLWMSDMVGECIFTLSENGQVTKVAHLAERPSGLSFLPDGRFIAASMRDRKLYAITSDGKLSLYADLSDVAAGDLNDSVVDAAGNIYLGNFGFDLASGEEPKPTQLHIVTPDGRVSVAAENMMFPNGAVITPDRKTLIIAETFAGQLTAFTRSSDGTLSDRRVWAELPDHMPDGICLDASGAVWVSSIGPGVFLRVAEGGEIQEELTPQGARAVACCLGGSDGKTLFALTFDGTLEEIWTGIKKARVETFKVDIGAADPAE
jgi:sugar lactone lactonase YvrE